jgi:ABC-type xylose transport system substrate-binding protein
MTVKRLRKELGVDIMFTDANSDEFVQNSQIESPIARGVDSLQPGPLDTAPGSFRHAPRVEGRTGMAVHARSTAVVLLSCLTTPCTAKLPGTH